MELPATTSRPIQAPAPATGATPTSSPVSTPLGIGLTPTTNTASQNTNPNDASATSTGCFATIRYLLSSFVSFIVDLLTCRIFSRTTQTPPGGTQPNTPPGLTPQQMALEEARRQSIAATQAAARAAIDGDAAAQAAVRKLEDLNARQRQIPLGLRGLQNSIRQDVRQILNSFESLVEHEKWTCPIKFAYIITLLPLGPEKLEAAETYANSFAFNAETDLLAIPPPMPTAATPTTETPASEPVTTPPQEATDTSTQPPAPVATPEQQAENAARIKKEAEEAEKAARIKTLQYTLTQKIGAHLEEIRDATTRTNFTVDKNHQVKVELLVIQQKTNGYEVYNQTSCSAKGTVFAAIDGSYRPLPPLDIPDEVSEEEETRLREDRRNTVFKDGSIQVLPPLVIPRNAPRDEQERLTSEREAEIRQYGFTNKLTSSNKQETVAPEELGNVIVQMIKTDSAFTESALIQNLLNTDGTFRA